MTLSTLPKPCWDAAHNAARIMLAGSPNREDDRRQYLEAVDVLRVLLPASADVKGIVLDAARWCVQDDAAATIAGLPTEAFQ